jgi:chemotaxis protein MotC
LDKLANRDPAVAVDLKQAREDYGKHLIEMAGSEAYRDELRKHAEIFVLSGGDPSVLSAWEDGLSPGSPEEKLFEGVMAYGGGRITAAESALLSLDARSFDPMLGGHLALAQALLASRINPERAFLYFDAARLLLPGTIVEEAALRQIAVLAARTGNKDRFAEAATTYLGRFPRSAYIAGFETQLAFQVARFSGQDGGLVLRELLKAHPQGWGRCLPCFLATVAEQAVIFGKTGLAIDAALAASPLVADGSPEKQRLLLYHGAALIVTQDFERGRAALQSVKPESLSEKDRELLNATIALSAKLRATPMMLTAAKLEAFASESPKRSRAFLPGESVGEAKAALENVDAILNRKK